MRVFIRRRVRKNVRQPSPTPRARFHPPQTSSKGMMPRSPIIPAPFFPPVPCNTAESSRASCSYHRFSSRAMSRVTGTSVIRRPSCAREERMDVAVSDSAPPGDALSSLTVVSRSFSSPARRTISRALTMSASRSFSASFISSCADCADDCTPRTRPSNTARFKSERSRSRPCFCCLPMPKRSVADEAVLWPIDLVCVAQESAIVSHISKCMR